MDDEALMDLALAEARAAAMVGEVPVGAIVAVDGVPIAAAHNLREGHGDPTAHAELIALQRAAHRLGRWRLSGATVYVTLEPCAMCAGAIANARVGRLVFGATEAKTGAVTSQHQLLETSATTVTDGVLSGRCEALLQGFFEALRRRD